MSLAAGITAAAGLAGAGISTIGAESAAGTQAGAAEDAANLQYQLGEQNLGFQEQEWQQAQQNLAPWLSTGNGALQTLSQLLGVNPQSPGSTTSTVPTNLPNVPGVSTSTGRPTAAANPTVTSRPAGPSASQIANGTAARPATSPVINSLSQLSQSGTNPLVPTSLFQPFSQEFQPPTAQQAALYPGYQFARQQGEEALQNSAAAQGGLLSGGTEMGLEQYGQGLATQDYNNVYNQALQQYQQNYNIFNQNQANLFNRYASLAGVGQTAAQQLNATGTATAGQVGNTLTNVGSQIGQQLNNAGAANASGYAALGNIWGNTLSSLGGNASQYLLLSQLMNQGNQASTAAAAGY